MPGKMTDLIVRETSGVDHPAHLHEGFLVMKAADRPKAEAVLSAFGKKESQMGTSPAPTAAMSAEDIQKAIDKSLQPILDQFAEGWKALRDYAEKTDPATPSAEGVDPTADPVLAAQAQNEMALSADMLKSAPEAVVKAIESQRAELAKAREEVAKERTIRLDNEAIAFAKATYQNLNLPDETVKAIRRAGDIDPALAESLKALLVSHNAMLDGADITKELGTAASGDLAAGTATERVEEKAKALIAEGKYDTIQKARVAVYDAEPELAAAVKEEVR